MVYPILVYCLTKMDELKKRAFIGKYLVPLDIPAEFVQAPQISGIHQQVPITFDMAQRQNDRASAVYGAA